MMPRIEIVVRPGGQTDIQTKGFVGNACRLASAFLDRTLGRPLSERCTAEFYQSQATDSLQEKQHG